MEQRWVRVGGFALYPEVCSVLWESAQRAGFRRRVSKGRNRRPASGCPNCGAVVLGPERVERPPPTTPTAPTTPTT
jgi:hypothetical protein